MIAKFTGLMMLILLVVYSCKVSAEEYQDIKRGVFADGQLWILSDAGELSSITEGKDVRTVESLPEPAMDLCRWNGAPVVVTCAKNACKELTLRRRVNGQWLVAGTLQTDNEQFIALNCEEKDAIVLTSQRLVTLGRDKPSSIALAEKLTGELVSTHATIDYVYVGINHGEWGGGLRRINRHSGRIDNINKNNIGKLCGGPLNSECDPVNDIVTVPWEPDCVAAAIGLVHFRSHGRITEVCGKKVQRLYFKTYGKDEHNLIMEGYDEPFSTVAFFGLVSDGTSLWAVGIDGIYEIEKGGVVRLIPFPKFKEIGGVGVSFDLHNFVLVSTSINQRRALSGSTPMLIRR